MDTLNFQIDKDVPLPPIARNGLFHAALLQAFKEMQPTDSFLFTDETKSGSRVVTIREVARKNGVKVAIRKLEPTKYRVWKLE